MTSMLKKLSPRVIAKRSAINWVRSNDPALYRLAVKKYGLRKGLAVRQLSGVDSEEIEALGSISDFFSTLTDTVKQVAPTVLQYKAQTKILNTQLKRAQQGLPPLQVQDYSPVLRIAPDFSPESEAALTRMATGTVGSTLQRFALPIALGLGALFFLKRRR